MKVMNGGCAVVELTNAELIIFEKLKTVDDAIPNATFIIKFKKCFKIVFFY